MSDTFLSVIPSEDVPFFQRFFSTKMFAEFSSKEIRKIEEELKGSRTSIKRTNSTTSTKSMIKSEISNNHSLKLSKTSSTGNKSSSIGNVPKLTKLEDIKKKKIVKKN